ncbi:hypothetical protein [Falsiroseomonas oryziterrae]|uniref:hypothetical protein n=1 Tax=Falsiroseomonas oryziterrae TaxID=2911368 RepID=UPI001F296391|nr:hypothetical protein [Roseomonas sp. NPKOSM-4]
MLLRCARGMMAAPAMMAAPVAMGAGLVFATGLAVGAGAVGAALLAKRMYEERQGWRSGTTAGGDPLPPLDPIPDVPPAA